jgi:hypothetical protein
VSKSPKKRGHTLSVLAGAAASHTKMPAKKGKAPMVTKNLMWKQSSTRGTRNKKVETQRTERDKTEMEYVVSEMAPIFECSNSVNKTRRVFMPCVSHVTTQQPTRTVLVVGRNCE